MTICPCRKSRKRFKKRKLFESFEPEALPGYSSAGGYASAEPDYASAGYGGPRGGEAGGREGWGPRSCPLACCWAGVGMFRGVGSMRGMKCS